MKSNCGLMESMGVLCKQKDSNHESTAERLLLIEYKIHPWKYSYVFTYILYKNVHHLAGMSRIYPSIFNFLLLLSSWNTYMAFFTSSTSSTFKYLYLLFRYSSKFCNMSVLKSMRFPYLSKCSQRKFMISMALGRGKTFLLISLLTKFSIFYTSF